MAKKFPPVLTPVTAYEPLAEHYRKRVEKLTAEAVAAMRAGNLPKAVDLYNKGVFAQDSYDHYRRIASCIGDLNQPLLPKGEVK